MSFEIGSYYTSDSDVNTETLELLILEVASCGWLFAESGYEISDGRTQRRTSLDSVDD